jgi:ribosomal protein S14
MSFLDDPDIRTKKGVEVPKDYDQLTCPICGRPRGYYRKFNLCRICLRMLASRGERWRPFRSVASWYLWRALDEAPREQVRAR